MDGPGETNADKENSDLIKPRRQQHEASLGQRLIPKLHKLRCQLVFHPASMRSGRSDCKSDQSRVRWGSLTEARESP